MESTNEASILLDQSVNLSPPMISESTNLSKLEELEKKLKELFNIVSLLQKKNFILEKIVTEQKNKIDENNSYIINQDIYSRRNNVEFCNISENIDDGNLEEYILKILKALNMDISSYDIVAVHRLGKKKNPRPRNVIVRFLNRKDAYKSLKLNQKLEEHQIYKNIFITENLCPTNKKIFNALYKLKKSKIIHAVWTYNGNIYYRIDEDDDYQHASTLDDVQFLFDDIGEKDGYTAVADSRTSNNS